MKDFLKSLLSAIGCSITINIIVVNNSNIVNLK